MRLVDPPFDAFDTGAYLKNRRTVKIAEYSPVYDNDKYYDYAGKFTILVHQ